MDATGMAHRTALATIAAALLLAGTIRAQWLNYSTPGIPRLPDGKPDLSGIWAVECRSGQGPEAGGCADDALGLGDPGAA